MLSLLTLAALVGLSVQAGLLLDGSMPQQYVPIDTDPVQQTDAGKQAMAYQKPWFCHDLECPKFSTVKNISKDVELRHYEESMWVSTEVYVFEYTDDVNREMFYKLFNYISGNNSANMKIPMTAPVLTEVRHGAGPDCESNFTMNFMMPFNLQASPPMPKDPSVFITRLPAVDVYVKSYGGMSNDTLKRDTLISLIDTLVNNTLQFEDDVFYTAGYDGPYVFNNRHNEISVIAK